MTFVFTYSKKENTYNLKKCPELKMIEGEIIPPNLTHRISHKLNNSVCMITKLTATGTQQINKQNLIINRF